MDSGISIYDKYDLPSDVEIPMAHASEGDVEDWEEEEFNYRLNTAEAIYYAVKNKKVVGHLGISSDGEVLGVYVDSGMRGKGIALSLYEFAVNDLEYFWSDPSAQEPGGRQIWKALKKKYPNRVDLKKDKFSFAKEDLEEAKTLQEKIDLSIGSYEKYLGKPIAEKQFGDYVLYAYGDPKGTKPFRIMAAFNGEKVGDIDPWTPKMVAAKLGKDWGDSIGIPNAWVSFDHQRKGLATAMYDWAEELTGAEAVPWSYIDGGEEPMSSMGKAFWSSRGYELSDEEEDLDEAKYKIEDFKNFTNWVKPSFSDFKNELFNEGQIEKDTTDDDLKSIYNSSRIVSFSKEDFEKMQRGDGKLPEIRWLLNPDDAPVDYDTGGEYRFYSGHHKHGGIIDRFLNNDPLNMPIVSYDDKLKRYTALSGRHRIVYSFVLDVPLKVFVTGIPIWNFRDSNEMIGLEEAGSSSVFTKELAQSILGWIDPEGDAELVIYPGRWKLPAKFRKIPGDGIVYRGIGMRDAEFKEFKKTNRLKISDGSWTSDPEVAERFARDSDGQYWVLLKTKPSQSEVVAYLPSVIADKEFQKMAKKFPLAWSYVSELDESEAVLRDSKITFKDNVVNYGKWSNEDLDEDNKSVELGDILDKLSVLLSPLKCSSHSRGKCVRYSEVVGILLKKFGFNVELMDVEVDDQNHTILAIDRKTVVDFTLNQFKENYPFPFVVEVDSDEFNSIYTRDVNPEYEFKEIGNALMDQQEANNLYKKIKDVNESSDDGDKYEYFIATKETLSFIKKYDHFNRDSFTAASVDVKPKKNEILIRIPFGYAVKSSGNQSEIDFLINGEWVKKIDALQNILGISFDVNQLLFMERWVEHYDKKALSEIDEFTDKKAIKEWLEKNAKKVGNRYLVFHGDREERHGISGESSQLQFKYLTSVTTSKSIARNFGAPISDFGKPVGKGNVHGILISENDVFHIPSLWSKHSDIINQFKKEKEILVKPGAYSVSNLNENDDDGEHLKGQEYLDFIEKKMEKVRAKEDEIIAGGERPIAFRGRNGSKIVFISKGFESEGDWRITVFINGQPTSHVDYRSFAGAVRDADREGADLWNEVDYETVTEARGDWEKEGYSFRDSEYEISSDHYVPSVEVLFNGKVVGHVAYSDSTKGVYVRDVEVDSEHRRKGLATEMYSYIEKKTGRKMIPSGMQSDDAKKFWSQPNRKFGEARGDWEKEGYEIKLIRQSKDIPGDPKSEGFQIKAFDKDGNVAGAFLFHHHDENYIYPHTSTVYPEHRRLGLASAAYALAEKVSGKKLKPEGIDGQTDDAKKLWSQPNRPFGESLEERNKREGYYNALPEEDLDEADLHQSDIDSAISWFNELEGNEEFADEFIDKLETLDIQEVTPEYAAKNFKRTHGLTFDSDPWPGRKGEKFNQEFNDPSIVVKFGKEYFVLDGQHRMNQRIKDNLSIPVVIMDGEWMKKYDIDKSSFGGKKIQNVVEAKQYSSDELLDFWGNAQGAKNYSKEFRLASKEKRAPSFDGIVPHVIARYDKYKEIMVDPKDIAPNAVRSWDEPMSSDEEEYAQEYSKKSANTAPPVILKKSKAGEYKYDLIDGRHRTRAAAIRGSKVKAAVPIESSKIEENKIGESMNLQEARGEGSIYGMILFEGCDMLDILHFSHFATDEVDKLDEILKFCGDYFAKGIEAHPLVFADKSTLGKEDQPILKLTEGEPYKELFDALGKIAKYKYPKFIPHISVTTNVEDFVGVPSKYVITKNGEDVREYKFGQELNKVDEDIREDNAERKTYEYQLRDVLKVLIYSFTKDFDLYHGEDERNAKIKDFGSKLKNTVTHFIDTDRFEMAEVEAMIKDIFQWALDNEEYIRSRKKAKQERFAGALMDAQKLAKKVGQLPESRLVEEPVPVDPDQEVPDVMQDAPQDEAPSEYKDLDEISLKTGSIFEYEEGGQKKYGTIVSDGLHFYESNSFGVPEDKKVLHINILGNIPAKKLKNYKRFKKGSAKGESWVITGYTDIDKFQLPLLDVRYDLFLKYAPDDAHRRFEKLESRNYHKEAAELVGAFADFVSVGNDPNKFKWV